MWFLSKLKASALAVGLLLSTYAQGIVFGNAKSLSSYGDNVLVEIEVFNLYKENSDNLKFEVIELKNNDNNGKSYKIEHDVSFIKSNGLGWISILSKEKIYNGEVVLLLKISSENFSAKRNYKIKFFGKEKNRPVKTCFSKSIRLKCIDL